MSTPDMSKYKPELAEAYIRFMAELQILVDTVVELTIKAMEEQK